MDSFNQVDSTAKLVTGLLEPKEFTLKDPLSATEIPCIIAGKELAFRIPTVEELDRFRDHPVRRTGTANVTTIASFIDHVNRFKNPESAIFLDETAPQLVGVIDYHDRVNDGNPAHDPHVVGVMATPAPVALPRFRSHRTAYKFPVSDEWTAWSASDGKAMDQIQFATFIEEHVLDLLPPPDELTEELRKIVDLIGGRLASPSRMMELSRGLAVYEKVGTVNAIDITSGETTINFQKANGDADGKKLLIPNLFLIGIPVFKNDAPYQIAVRLRYRAGGGTVKWTYQMFKPDRVRRDAIRQVGDMVKDQTALPLFYGLPE